MCPAIAGAVITAVAAIGSAVQQGDNQRRQYHYQERLADQTSTNASQAADADYLATAERINQTRQAAAQEAWEASRGAESAQATLTAGAEFAGLSGSTVGDLRFSIATQAADAVATRQRNASWEEQQIMRSMVSIQNQQQSRLNSATPSPVQGVDYAGLLGGLGQSSAQFGSPGAKQEWNGK